MVFTSYINIKCVFASLFDIRASFVASQPTVSLGCSQRTTDFSRDEGKPHSYCVPSTMNDKEVREQLKPMVAFIESEARDKAQEIRVRAEEEFQVQKQSVEQ